jgi:hypothetical protein
VVALNNRAHVYVQPSAKEMLIQLFTTILGCGTAAQLPNPGRSEPILAFRFPGGGSISFEFEPGAPDDPNGNRGAWLEIKADDLEMIKAALTDAGLRRVSHPATPTNYFVLPGGQVIGFV